MEDPSTPSELHAIAARAVDPSPEYARGFLNGMREAAKGLDVSASTIRLHTGEMTAREMRSVRAVLRWLMRDTMARAEHTWKHLMRPVPEPPAPISPWPAACRQPDACRERGHCLSAIEDCAHRHRNIGGEINAEKEQP